MSRDHSNNNLMTENIQNQKPSSFSTFKKLFDRVSAKDKIVFTRNMYTMIQSGLSLPHAFKIINQQTESPKFKNILETLKSDIERGKTFADALARYPKVFNAFYVNIVKVGEASGKLEECLKHLTNKLERDMELSNKIKSAMMYPIVVLTTMLIIIVLMIVFVLPELAAIFKEFNVPLPWTTRTLIAFSDLVSNYGIFMLIGVILFVIIFVMMFRSKSGRIIIHRISLRLPIFSPILKKMELSRFSRTLNTLIVSGVPIIRSFEITSSVLGNYLYQKSVMDATSLLKRGVKIVDILEKEPKLFPPFVSQMISVGEETGNLDQILSDVARFYEEEITRTMNNLASIIEPILLILLGIGVAIIALSVFSPIYSLIGQIQ